jgi:hypothetical protein
MKGRQSWQLGLGTIILIVLALLVMVVLATRRNQTLMVGQTVQFDDFLFTVLDAAMLPADPARANRPDQPAGRVDYLVRLKVENKARRVPFKFGGESLAVADPTATNRRLRPWAERMTSGELAPPVVHVLKAGEDATYDYFFSLPEKADDLRLRIAPGGWSGDFLEWLIFGRKEWRLPSAVRARSGGLHWYAAPDALLAAVSAM